MTPNRRNPAKGSMDYVTNCTRAMTIAKETAKEICTKTKQQMSDERGKRKDNTREPKEVLDSHGGI